MKKRILSLLLILLLGASLLPGAALADNTIIANLGSIDAGVGIDQLVLTTETGVAVNPAGMLPPGCDIVTEERPGGSFHYLRGIPTTPGAYEFTLTIRADGEDDSEVIATLTCSLTVNPAAPQISVSEDLSCFVGDNAVVRVSASSPDGGVLSYQWYSNSTRSNQNGALIGGATGAELTLSTAVPGTNYYYCVVTNSSGGSYSAVSSPAIAVTVSTAEPSALSVNVMPDKRDYTVGDTLDTTGLQLLLRYTNGSSELISSGFEAQPRTLDKAGTQAITVSYKGLSCTYPVLVEEAEEQVLDLQVVNLPRKLDYVVGDWLDTTGLTLRVDTNKGSYDVSTGFSCMPRILDTEGRQTITVNYGTQTTSFNVDVKAAEKRVESISVSKRPTKLSYQVGDTLDTSGMVLTVVTNKGTEEVSEGFVCLPTVFTRAGTQTVTISYQGNSCTMDFVVSEVPASPSPVPSGEPTPSAAPSPTQSPAVATPKPDIRPERKGGSPLVLVVIIAAAIALAALLAYVYVLKQDQFQAFFKKLIGLFKKK